MKKLFTILMLIPTLLIGQNEPNTKIDSVKNKIYGEAHSGPFYPKLAINYERLFLSGEKVSWYGRLGGGWGGSGINWGWGCLGAITMLTGKKNHHFELNGGSFLSFQKFRKFSNHNLLESYLLEYAPFILPKFNLVHRYTNFLIFNLGYRYQKPEGGFIFRANAGIISLGLSLGYAF